MDDSIAERVARMERSQIRVMFDMAEAHGGDLVRLEVGEPDFAPPEHVTEAAVEAARSGKVNYTSNAGIFELREAVSDRMATDHDVAVDPEQVVVTVGALEALHLAMVTLVDPGEEVVIPTPAWPNYVGQVRLADGKLVEVPLPAEDGFALDADRVVEAITDDTAVVVLNSPSNPTGRVFDPEDVRQVAAAAADHDAFVIADEAYLALAFEGDRRGIAAIVDEPEKVITVGTCSKTYAMTGYRLGWLAAPPVVAEGAAKIHESTTACASSISQYAALAALTGPQEPTRNMRESFRERRNLVVDRVAEIPHVSCAEPEGAFYAFLDVSALDGTSLDVAKRLLREGGVVVAPGEGFGDAGQGHVRLSFASSPEDLHEGLDGIEALVRDELE